MAGSGTCIRDEYDPEARGRQALSGEYERHYGVCLSRAGKKRDLEIIRHHRLIETFLFEVLNYSLDELHDEAERVEHFISESFEKRIAAKLGDPELDPHGHCIPSLCLRSIA